MKLNENTSLRIEFNNGIVVERLGRGENSKMKITDSTGTRSKQDLIEWLSWLAMNTLTDDQMRFDQESYEKRIHAMHVKEFGAEGEMRTAQEESADLISLIGQYIRLKGYGPDAEKKAAAALTEKIAEVSIALDMLREIVPGDHDRMRKTLIEMRAQDLGVSVHNGMIFEETENGELKIHNLSIPRDIAEDPNLSALDKVKAVLDRAGEMAA